MKYVAIVVVCACVSAVAGYYVYAKENRFYLQASGNLVYRIDRRTGETWRIDPRRTNVKSSQLRFESSAEIRAREQVENQRIREAERLAKEEAYFTSRGYRRTQAGQFVKRVDGMDVWLRDANGKLVDNVQIAKLLIKDEPSTR